jgi:YVTN family beta-propeller protein
MGGHWRDTLGRDWDNGVRFTLPDEDVFTIDAAVDPPVATGTSWAGVGTILFDMAVQPTTGKIYVSNTDANNLTRFEGDRTGSCATSTVRGHLHEARITVLDGASVLPRHLNKHLEPYASTPTAADRAKSLATPTAIAIDGATLYVAAFGSSAVGVFDTTELDANTFTPDAADHIAVSGGGPSGLVLRGGRLYVLTRFDNAVSVVDTTTRTEIAHVPLFNPEPASVVDGRPFLYDAAFTSDNGEASCSSCHVFGDFDSLAWDLGDPDIATLNNPSFLEVDLGTNKNFRALKGPMTTQSLRGMANHGPMHWRGDRTGGNDPGGDPLDEDAAFKKFNVAFPGLLGRSTQLTAAEMQAFTDFILQVTYPPNPIRALGNVLNPSEQAGFDTFNGPITDVFKNCNGCHRLDPAQGFFGTGGNASFENEPQIFKIPHLRNMYQKVGMFGMPQVSLITSGNNGSQGDQVRGFGFLHDGSVDTLFRFHGASVFTLTTQQRQDLEAFMLAFDSNLAPIVGQQTTLTSGNAAEAGPRITLLTQRAAATPPECDVVVKGTIAGEPRGWVRLAGGQFRSDDSGEPLLSDAALRALAGTAGQELTYTCAPPGSGTRIGIDRDEDGCLDHEDPAPDDALVVCGAATTTTTTSVPGTTTTTIAPSGAQALLTTKLVLKDKPGDPSKRRMKLLSRDPAVGLGTGNGSGEDPVLSGASLTVSSMAASFAGSYALPAGGWQYLGPAGANLGYKYRDPKGLNGPVVRAVVKAGRLVKVVAKGPALDLALGTNPDPTSVRLGIGGRVYCAEAGGTVSFTASKVYVAKTAPAPATCP